MPCELERGIARLDQTIKILKMAPGEYAPTQFMIGGPVTVYGHGATVNARLVIGDPAEIKVRGLSMRGFDCSRNTGRPVLELDRVTLTGQSQVFGCIVAISRSRIETGAARALFQVMDAGTAVTIDRTLLQNSGSIWAAGGIQITNSIFRNMPRPIDHPGGASSISFSTFIESPIQCMGGAQYNNNILVASSVDVISNTADDPCSYSYNLMSRQSTAPPTSYMNRIGEPLFVDASVGDYHLRPGGPAIDAGYPLPMVAVDFDGTARPQGVRLDIGAFEYKP